MNEQPSIVDNLDRWVVVKAPWARTKSKWRVFGPDGFVRPIGDRTFFHTWREAWDYAIAKATEAAK